jgi:hypothetical protein
MKLSIIYKIYIFIKPALPMFKNIRYYLLGAVILFLIAAVVTVNLQAKKIKRIEADNFRLEGNQFALMSDARQQTNLYLNEKEVTGRMKKERDSLAKSLNIKPRQLQKIIYIDNSTHDTVKVPVPVTITGKNEWLLQDSGQCFKYASKLILKGDSLKGERQLFEYNNQTTQVFYKQRPHKFLFFRFGKWVYKSKIESECGETIIKTFNFTK